MNIHRSIYSLSRFDCYRYSKESQGRRNTKEIEQWRCSRVSIDWEVLRTPFTFLTLLARVNSFELYSPGLLIHRFIYITPAVFPKKNVPSSRNAEEHFPSQSESSQLVEAIIYFTPSKISVDQKSSLHYDMVIIAKVETIKIHPKSKDSSQISCRCNNFIHHILGMITFQKQKLIFLIWGIQSLHP